MSLQVSYIRWEVSDELWARIEPLLPRWAHHDPRKGGRPRVPDRRAMNGILFVLKTGCQWNALNATRICSSSTAHLRFQAWTKAGVFLKLWQRGLTEYDELKGIDWFWQSMDGAMTKAPLGGEKNREKPHRPSETRGQAFGAHRRGRGPDRLGRGRSQPSRHEIGRDHFGEYSRQPARSNTPTSPRAVFGQRV